MSTSSTEPPPWAKLGLDRVSRATAAAPPNSCNFRMTSLLYRSHGSPADRPRDLADESTAFALPVTTCSKWLPSPLGLWGSGTRCLGCARSSPSFVVSPPGQLRLVLPDRSNGMIRQIGRGRHSDEYGG